MKSTGNSSIDARLRRIERAKQRRAAARNQALFGPDMPFNLAGESLNAQFDAEQAAEEKHVRETAEAEARKAQATFPQFGQDWINATPRKVYPLHDDTNENAL